MKSFRISKRPYAMHICTFVCWVIKKYGNKINGRGNMYGLFLPIDTLQMQLDLKHLAPKFCTVFVL